jgi:hypothetical protein
MKHEDEARFGFYCIGPNVTEPEVFLCTERLLNKTKLGIFSADVNAKARLDHFAYIRIVQRVSMPPRVSFD